MRASRLSGAAPIALAFALVLAPAAVSAQASIASEEECGRLPSPEEELACLREALAASREALRRADPQQPTPAPRAAPAATQEREIASAPSAPPIAAAPAADLGGEQVARAQPAQGPDADRSEAVTARVTDVRTDLRGLLVMQLDNGQIWRQDERVGGPIQLSENQQVGVEITRSGFGGYRMRFPELGRRIAVSRLR